MTTILRRIKVWDLGTRLFHWLNVILVFTLIAIGLVIFNSKILGIEGDAKVLLKTIHSYVGYAFVTNLGWRFIWAFTGGHYARWRQLLPFGKGFLHSFGAYLVGFFSSNPRRYLGHNPVGRLIISLFFLLLTSQAITGLIITGTDLYFPPFGGYFAEWVTGGDPQRMEALRPGDKTHVREDSYAEMRAFRKPIITTHVYGFYGLIALIIIHIAGVVVTEVREKPGLVSAMINGEKILDAPAEDERSELPGRDPDQV